MLLALSIALIVNAAAVAVELRGRIVDAETGQPLPARLYVRGERGAWFHARPAEDAGRAIPYDKRRGRSVEVHTTLSAHPFTADLPPGRYTLTAERGHEYLPAVGAVDLGDGPADITLALRRWIDMAGRGWFSGDTHVHRTLDELPNVLLAEDLNVAMPLTQWVTASHTPPARGDRADAAPPPAPRLIRVDETHVIWPLNTEYEIFTTAGRRHTLGAVFVLNHRRPLEVGAPPVGPVAEAARRQGALLDLDKHNWPWSMMLVPVMGVDLFELANNHLWRTDFHFADWYQQHAPPYMKLEMTADGGFTERGWIDFGFQTYYALLNCGFRMRPTAGTASGVHPVPLGFGRVYARLPDGFGYERWIEALDAGRTFITTGPMLTIAFDGHDAGRVFRGNDDSPLTLRITGEAHSARPLDRIEIVVNGRVARTLAAANRPTGRGGHISPIDAAVTLDGSGWAAVRCWEPRDGGPPSRRAGIAAGGRLRFAHTAPVHIEISGRPLRPRREEIEYLIGRVRDEIDRNRGVLSDEELGEYERSLAVYREIAERAR